jgi:hypothetical protein
MMMVVRALVTLFLGSPSHSKTANNSSSNLMEGTYHLASSYNFDAYLAELGVSFILRRLANLASPTVTISRYECTSCEKCPLCSPKCLQ